MGGRLSKSSLPENQKFPIILPKNNQLTQLIVSHYHLINLHAGPSLLLATLHQKYWIVNGRDVVRHFVRKCVKCYRQIASVGKQMMGDLCAARVNKARAFLKTGVDYAGPIYIRVSKNRIITPRQAAKIYKSNNNIKIPVIKSYIAVFVCYVTGAIHIELVSDYKSDSFIATLNRFISRRGKPVEMHSDNGTNFIGAQRELKNIEHMLKSNKDEKVMNFLSTQEIKWYLNPPGAPHFGGLWEAGVKSTKYHLKRVIGNHHLSFEELSTLLCQIEACLNSRPLTQLSTDPSDLGVLTPGHFLIGEPLTSVPDPDLTNIKLNRLSRWQLIQQLYQHFWKRWTSEFLNRLQQRPKWVKKEVNFKVGDIVLVKDENFPPLKWNLARIIKVYPGADGQVRVCDIKTSTSELKRPIHKLCLLPIDTESVL